MVDSYSEKLAESLPQALVDFFKEFLKQYDCLYEDHPDYETLWEIAIFYLAYEEGDKDALLTALRMSCDLKQVAMPLQVAQNVHENLIKWSELEVKTLDEAFEVEKPKGFMLKGAKRKHKISSKIYTRITVLSKSGNAIDDYLFEVVGNEFGIGKTLTKDYYYEHKRLVDSALVFALKYLSQNSANS